VTGPVPLKVKHEGVNDGRVVGDDREYGISYELGGEEVSILWNLWERGRQHEES
jgi:hypothetical protein